MIRTHGRHASWKVGLRLAVPLLVAASLAGADDAAAPTSASGPAEAAAAPAPAVAAAPTASGPDARVLVVPVPAEPVVVEPFATEAVPPLSAASLPDAPAPVLPAPALPALVRPAPVLDQDSVDPDVLREVAQLDVAALGPLSIGTPDAGLLVNPQPMPEGALWTIRNPLETWGTQETIDFVVKAIETVDQRFPGSPRVVVGDISRPDGGRLNRHKSHQAGRDIDVGFFYTSGEASDFKAVQARSRSKRRGAAAPQLDLPRTWALMRAFLTETDVDRIFLDRSLISVLYRYAREQEQEDRAWLDDVFGRAERKGLVQHEKKHKDHMHVRFFNRVAQERGRIVYPLLVAEGVVGPPLVRHRVRRGETIGLLAEEYGTSAAAIRAANRLRGNQLRAGRSYLVPVRHVRGESEPVVVPPRRLPPSTASEVAATPAPADTSDVDVAAAGGGRN
jgi:murein endopeptidase